jgi:4a-hydroxytetrahydrobiopterin dehydratase
MAEGVDTLAKKDCVPCKGGVPPLKGEELEQLHAQLGNGWDLVEEHHLEKEFDFPDFASALEFVNAVGAVAEEQNHHPDILLTYGMVKVSIWTHKIDGLTESDFVFAAKTQKAYG